MMNTTSMAVARMSGSIEHAYMESWHSLSEIA